MPTYKIVLAGGPGTGKSTTLQALVKKGCCCLEEVSRQVTLEAQQQGITQLFLTDPLLFSQKLLEGRIAQYKKTDTFTEDFCFLDRGIPDVSAYMEYKNEAVPQNFREADQNFRYDQIFFFPIWEDIYNSDNERYESLEEAKKIQYFLRNAYQNLGYNIIEVPKISVEARVDFILKKTKDALSK